MFKKASQSKQRRTRVRLFQSDVDGKLRCKMQRRNENSAAVLALQKYENEKTPGILYRHFDATGVLLYVGSSLNAISRTSKHRLTVHWYSQIATISLEHFSSRVAAMEAEQLAIKNEKPKYNIRGL
jgi:excinuclease UvrABC nuclease subunit